MARNRIRSFAIVVFAGLAVAITHAAEPAPMGEVITVVDGEGKEIKLTGVKFTLGVRRLAWLGEVAAPADEEKKGPWGFEIREPDSTTFQKGVVTLIPLPSIEGVQYDYSKLAAAITVKGLKEPVVGSTKYKGFCFLGLEGDVGGVKAKLTGGEFSKAKTGPRTGFKSVAFPGAKPLPPRSDNAATWTVRVEGLPATDPPHTVRNLKAIYQLAPGVEFLVDVLSLRKGDPISLGGAKPASFKKLEVLAVDPNKKSLVVELDGERTAIVPTGEHDKKPATLLGFLGEVESGWKLFPLHTVASLELGK